MRLSIPFLKRRRHQSATTSLLTCAGLLALALTPFPVAAEPPAEPEAAAAIEAEAPDQIQQPFLWTATSPNGEKAYLFGTIHTADPRIVNLPDSILNPLNKADGVLVELIINPQQEAALALAMLHPNGSPLSERLPQELWKQLDAELKRINPILNPVAFDTFHTWAIALLLPLVEEELAFIGQTILDDKLVNLAKAREIETHALESVDEQMAALTWMSDEEQILFLKAVIIGMEDARRQHNGISHIEFMKQLYLRGDADAMLELLEWQADLEGYDEFHAKFLDKLVNKRNHIMVNRFKEFLAKDKEKVWFVAAGLLHFIGDEGIINLLEKEGWVIKRVEG